VTLPVTRRLRRRTRRRARWLRVALQVTGVPVATLLTLRGRRVAGRRTFRNTALLIRMIIPSARRARNAARWRGRIGHTAMRETARPRHEPELAIVAAVTGRRRRRRRRKRWKKRRK